MTRPRRDRIKNPSASRKGDEPAPSLLDLFYRWLGRLGPFRLPVFAIILLLPVLPMARLLQLHLVSTALRSAGNLLPLLPAPRDSSRFRVGLTYLVNDPGNQYGALLWDELKRIPGIDAVKVRRWLPSSGEPPSPKDIALAKQTMRDVGATILLWGYVLSRGDDRVPQLFWSTSAEDDPVVVRGRYAVVSSDLALPGAFWSDLGKNLTGLVIMECFRSIPRGRGEEARRTAASLTLLQGQVTNLEGSSKELHLSREDNLDMRLSLALGFASNGSVPVDESGLESLLELTPRDSLPRTWGAIQSELAVLRVTRAEQTDDLALLKRVAVDLESTLVVVVKRGRPSRLLVSPRDVAKLLGEVHRRLGERTSDASELRAAIQILERYDQYEEPPTSFDNSREAALSRGSALNSLAGARSSLGVLTGNRPMQKRGLSEYRQALALRTIQADPSGFADTQTNIAQALLILSERGNDDAYVGASIDAVNQAIDVYARQGKHVEWALATIRRADALTLRGSRLGSRQILSAAVEDYRRAIGELSAHHRERLAIEAQHNLELVTHAMASHDSAMRN